MEVLFNESIPRESWIEFLKNNPHSTLFQSPEFYDFIKSVDKMSAEAIAIMDSASIKALVVITLQKGNGIKGFFSRRGIIYGGTLISDNNEASEQLLKNISAKLKNKTIYIESRNLSDYSSVDEIFNRYGFKYTPWLNFNLNTRDKETVVSAMSNSRLRQIKKAIKNGVNWREALDRNEVRSFYLILSDLYAKKVGKPLPPFDFFLKFFETLLGKYLLVIYKDKIIGGIMCPIFKQKTIYELYVCGLDQEYKEQYPSVMATWAAIDYACQNKIPVFDFMGAGRPDDKYGVRDFKARFGGEIREYGRFIKINNTFLYKIGIAGLKMGNLLSK